MTNLTHFIRQPTLGHVCHLARQTTMQHATAEADACDRG
jgi:hypothetical protein